MCPLGQNPPPHPVPVPPLIQLDKRNLLIVSSYEALRMRIGETCRCTVNVCRKKKKCIYMGRDLWTGGEGLKEWEGEDW